MLGLKAAYHHQHNVAVECFVSCNFWLCFLNVVQRTYVHVLVSMWLLQPGRLAVRTSVRRPRMQSDTFALQVDYRVCSCNRCSQLPHQQLPLYRAIQVHTHTAVVCGSCSSWRLARRSFVVSSSRHSACVCMCTYCHPDRRVTVPP